MLFERKRLRKRKEEKFSGGDVVWGEPVWRGRRGSRIAVAVAVAVAVVVVIRVGGLILLL